MKHLLDMSTLEISKTFASWNKGLLNSFLIEISAKVLAHKDPENDGQLIDHILDRAMMKGTGTLAVKTSLMFSNGVIPVPTIYAALQSRAISSPLEKRKEMHNHFSFPKSTFIPDNNVLPMLKKSLYISKISSYAQGFDLIRCIYEEQNFGELRLGTIAEIWRNGSIIRAKFLEDVAKAYNENPDMRSLLMFNPFTKYIKNNFPSFVTSSHLASTYNIPIPAFDASKNFILQSFSDELGLNMIQGLRDYFGAHSYERIDKDGFYHTEWNTVEKKEKRI